MSVTLIVGQQETVKVVFRKIPDEQFFRLDTKLVKYDRNFANTTHRSTISFQL